MAKSGLLKYTGTRQPASAAENTKSNICFEQTAMAQTSSEQLVICLNNTGYAASLERRKIYVVLPDDEAEKSGLLRVIDESGEDYLYPKSSFSPITLPQALKEAVLAS